MVIIIIVLLKCQIFFYNNQYRLNLKLIYDLITFITILKNADKDLIGYFNELYIETNPNTKNDKTNENNKKK